MGEGKGGGVLLCAEVHLCPGECSQEAIYAALLSAYA